MKQLIIAEKPSLAMVIVNTIGNMEKKDGYFEGDKYIVSFAYGHLLGLYDIDDYFNRDKTKWTLGELPYVPGNFKFKLKDDSGVKKQYSIIKKLIGRQDVECIVNCGDADREGEVIINNIIYNIFNEEGINKNIKRLWLPEQTTESIRQALLDLKDISIYKNLYNEGLARTYIDWLLGINLTRYVSIKANVYLPVGRVLVPIIKNIYDRDIEIKNFKPEVYHEIGCSIVKDGIEIKSKIKNLKFNKDSKSKGEDFLKLLKNEKAMVKDIIEKEVRKKPKKLFSLDTLQNKMFEEANISLSDTLSILQKLYENGYITYPRTNTEYLAENEKDKINKVIAKIRDIEEVNIKMKDIKSIFDNKKIESHSALTITTKIPESLSEKENLVYTTIKNRFISNFLDEETVVLESKITMEIGGKEIEFKGNVIKDIGFLKYENDVSESQLPHFYIGEELSCKLSFDKKETQKPKKITEAALNRFLKNPFRSDEVETDDELYKDILNGIEIGTVATRAGIIENAKKYGYINESKGTLGCTEKGIALIETLDNLGVNIYKEKTVEFGKSLKLIYKNELSVDELINTVSDELYYIIDLGKDIKVNKINTLKVIAKCPICKTGNIIEGKKAYGCTEWKNGCKFTIWKEIASKKLTENQIKALLNEGKTGKIKGFKGKNGKFEAKLKLVNGKIEFIWD
ncbi:MAG: DNA topoisomerase [Peptostreptococcaceae bacterium]